MSRRKDPIQDGLAWEIYVELRKWRETHDTIPTMHAFWQFVLPSVGYTMKFGKFRYQWDELIKAGLVMHEKKTNAVIVVRSWAVQDVALREMVAEIEQAERRRARSRARKRPVFAAA